MKMKYMIGKTLHMLLEDALVGKVISIDDIVSNLGCKLPIAKRLLSVSIKYKKSTKFAKWLTFFNKYNHNWELHIEEPLTVNGYTIIPDILLINDKKSKIVVVDIKTGDRTKKKATKILVQLFKYYSVLKYLFPRYKITMYVFWVKRGEFEMFNHLVAEMYKTVHRYYTTKSLIVGGINHAKNQKPTKSVTVFGLQ